AATSSVRQLQNVSVVCASAPAANDTRSKATSSLKLRMLHLPRLGPTPGAARPGWTCEAPRGYQSCTTWSTSGRRSAHPRLPPVWRRGVRGRGPTLPAPAAAATPAHVDASVGVLL